MKSIELLGTKVAPEVRKHTAGVRSAKEEFKINN
jgi:hypothetical protein